MGYRHVRRRKGTRWEVRQGAGADITERKLNRECVHLTCPIFLSAILCSLVTSLPWLKHSLHADAQGGCGCLFKYIQMKSQQLHDAWRICMKTVFPTSAPPFFLPATRDGKTTAPSYSLTGKQEYCKVENRAISMLKCSIASGSMIKRYLSFNTDRNSKRRQRPCRAQPCPTDKNRSTKVMIKSGRCQGITPRHFIPFRYCDRKITSWKSFH